MNWLSRFLPGGGPGLSPEQQAGLDLVAGLPAPDLTRSHYETRYVVVNTETGPADGAGQRLLAVGAVAINRGLIHPGDAWHARLGEQPADALVGLLRFIARAPVDTIGHLDIAQPAFSRIERFATVAQAVEAGLRRLGWTQEEERSRRVVTTY